MTPRRRDLTMKTYDDCENVLLRESPLMSNISLKLKCLVLLTLLLLEDFPWLYRRVKYCCPRKRLISAFPSLV